MALNVSLSRSAEKELGRLPDPLRSRMLKQLHALAENPHPRGSKKLEGTNEFYRIRVGEYRILYSVDSKAKEVVVAAIAHRSEVYRDK